MLMIAALAACSSESPTAPSTVTPAGPTAGWLTVQLSTPNSNDGAVQLAVAGPAIDSVAITDYDGFASRTSNTVNMVIDGQITSGNVARILVPDISLAGDYQASVSAAAARDSYGLQSTQGYRAIIVR
jgi:hypothetical protein